MARDASLEPLRTLIGAWDTEATHPMLDGVVPGRVVFEWLEGERFLVQRFRHDHEQVPDSISVIGAPEDGVGLVLEYFDSRGVRRTYGVSVDGGVWLSWREAPGFDQRFAAALDLVEFVGRWQVARTPGAWQDDLDVVFRRRDDRPAAGEDQAPDAG